MPSPTIGQVVDFILGHSSQLVTVVMAVAIVHLSVILFRRFRDAISPESAKPTREQYEYQRRVFDELANQEALVEILTEIAKAKREPVDQYDDPPEPDFAPVDYVVGFGDDGELIYASEEHKRKNDEVDE